MVSIHLCYCPDLPQTRLISPPNIVPTTLSSNSSFPSNLSAKRHLVELPKPIAPTLSAKPTPGQILAPVRSSAELPKPGLKIGIVGFGNFGRFLARAFVTQGHYVLATSRSDYSEYCHRHGIEFFGNVDEMCGEQPDIVLICTSILSTENVVRGIPFHKLKPNTIFVDVLSVKQFPMNLFLEVLPPEFGIVCTHPMFGPESGKHSWEGLSFVYDEVRVANNHQYQKCSQFLRIFEREGCRMVKMSCEEHDRHAAGSQFITHTIGRILSHLELESTPINTKGYETLLQLTENTVSDSFDLYYGLFMYNVNATEQIENLDRAFETVKQKLFGRLHDILRKQIVERVPLQPPPKTSSNTNTCYFLPRNEDMKDISSFAIAPSSLKEETHGGPLPLTENATVGGR